MKERTKISIKSRQKYQQKRSGKRYHYLRSRRLARWLSSDRQLIPTPTEYLPPINLEAPYEFKFIDNTNRFLDYIDYARETIKMGKSIRFDISKIKSLSSESIPLLISHIKDPNFTRGIPIFGNAPEDSLLKRRFTESGFYEFVRSSQKFIVSDGNLMHKESNFKVKPDIAEKATLLALQNGTYNENEIEAVYNMFIELMSNTHHHANLKLYGKSKWWLYVYNDLRDKTTEVCFLDLGVGVFKSIIVRKYIRKLGLKLKLVDNSSLVKDLLEGKIRSRIEEDNEIRGKGIPQILEYARGNCFRKFFLITNDLKINVKTGEVTKLRKSFAGTFYYFELASNN